jgi:hypothetical protein
MSSWWSEGETGAIQVYRQSFTGYLATVAVSAAILVLFPRTWYVLILCILIPCRAFLERRRAIIFTETALIYRPAFSHAIYIPFSNIESVGKSTVPLSFWMRSRLFKGLRIHLKDGKDVLVPLDFPQSSDISRGIAERF